MKLIENNLGTPSAKLEENILYWVIKTENQGRAEWGKS